MLDYSQRRRTIPHSDRVALTHWKFMICGNKVSSFSRTKTMQRKKVKYMNEESGNQFFGITSLCVSHRCTVKIDERNLGTGKR